MQKYGRLLLYEFKNILREKMTLVLLIYPVFIIVLGSFVLPVLIENYGTEPAGQSFAAMVLIVVFASLAPFVTSALLGFSLLDHKDENTFDTLRVTPLSLKGYIIFKSAYAYLLSVNASFWVLFGVKHLSGDGYVFGGIDPWASFGVSNMLVYAFVSGFFTPAFALFLAAMSKNKIEGFAYMKTAGILALLPALTVLENLQDFKQYFLGVFPIFWPVKGMMVDVELLEHSHNLPVWLYMLIGVLYPLVLSIFAFEFFEKRLQ